MPSKLPEVAQTALLLTASNLFMTTAWYGHLKHQEYPLWTAIVVSWLIALPEYCLQVPANRWGFQSLSAFQLKVLQEAITLAVFCAFAYWYLGEKLKWNYALAGLFLLAAVAAAFWN